MAAHLTASITTASVRGRDRAHNEDAALVRPRRGLLILAVADGMGGGIGGEIASRAALHAFAGAMQRLLAIGVSLGDAAAGAVHHAARAVQTEAAQHGSPPAAMATTLTAACIHNGNGVLAHAGDSRAYLWRAHSLQQLTDDHSVTAELVRTGAISASSARRHQHRHVLTQAVGAPGLRPQIQMLTILPGDVLVLCSDGVHKTVLGETLEALLAEAQHPVAARVVSAAAGDDDATAVVAEFSLQHHRNWWIWIAAVLALAALMALALPSLHQLLPGLP